MCPLQDVTDCSLLHDRNESPGPPSRSSLSRSIAGAVIATGSESRFERCHTATQPRGQATPAPVRTRRCMRRPSVYIAPHTEPHVTRVAGSPPASSHLNISAMRNCQASTIACDVLPHFNILRASVHVQSHPKAVV